MALATTKTKQSLADYLGITLAEVEGLRDMEVIFDRKTRVAKILRLTVTQTNEVKEPGTNKVLARRKASYKKDITLT